MNILHRTTLGGILSATLFGLLAFVWVHVADAGGGACHGIVGEREANGVAVSLRNRCVEPVVLHAAVGDEITFTNEDKTPHIITGVAGQWGSTSDLQKGDTYTMTFAEPGIYPFSCRYHYGMTGAIAVESVAADEPDRTGAPVDGDVKADQGGGPSVALLAGGAAVGLLAATGTGAAVWRRQHDG